MHCDFAVSDATSSIYAVVAVYLIVCAIWLMVASFTAALSKGDTALDKVKNLFFVMDNAVLLAAIASTIGIYLLASLIYVSYSNHARPDRIQLLTW